MTQLSTYYLLPPFMAQILCMAIDEAIHHHRGLPRWERIGHPLDTLTVAACYGCALLVPSTRTGLFVYVALACFSCLIVTKDEPIHLRSCGPVEQWLHSILFILHPVTLICLGVLWPSRNGEGLSFFHQEGFESAFLVAGFSVTVGFAVYQTLYWNFVWKPK